VKIQEVNSSDTHIELLYESGIKDTEGLGKVRVCKEERIPKILYQDLLLELFRISKEMAKGKY
jgi:hypothetical protein